MWSPTGTNSQRERERIYRHLETNQKRAQQCFNVSPQIKTLHSSLRVHCISVCLCCSGPDFTLSVNVALEGKIIIMRRHVHLLLLHTCKPITTNHSDQKTNNNKLGSRSIFFPQSFSPLGFKKQQQPSPTLFTTLQTSALWYTEQLH